MEIPAGDERSGMVVSIGSRTDTLGGIVWTPADTTMLFMAGGFLFGWAKPVPVNFGRLNQPRRDMVLVAAAGPASNLVLAAVSALGFHLLPFASETLGTWLADALGKSILINLVLAVLNMLPLPPLDGGRVAVGLLPRALALPLARLERWGLLILIGGLFLLPMLGRQIGLDLDLFHWLIGVPVNWLLPFFAAMAVEGGKFSFDETDEMQEEDTQY